VTFVFFRDFQGEGIKKAALFAAINVALPVFKPSTNGEEKMNEEKSLKLLYTALADELLASYQYWVCKNSSRGEGKSDADPEFEEHAKEEMEHADKVMLRIKELNGTPIPDPKDWAAFANPWKPVDFREVKSQLRTTIAAEKAAIDFYYNAMNELKGEDEVTFKLFRDILIDEEKHYYDLKELLDEVDPSYNFTARKRMTAKKL
jgi:bacterioferritin